MKIQIFTAAAILALSATTASAVDVMSDNNSINAIAIGGNAEGGSTSYLAGMPYGDSYNGNKKAIAGSTIIDDCDCFDKMHLTNDSTNALAVGSGVAGSVLIEEGYTAPAPYPTPAFN